LIQVTLLTQNLIYLLVVQLLYRPLINSFHSQLFLLHIWVEATLIFQFFLNEVVLLVLHKDVSYLSLLTLLLGHFIIPYSRIDNLFHFSVLNLTGLAYFLFHELSTQLIGIPCPLTHC